MPIAIYEGGSEMPIRLIDSDYWRARDIRKLKPRTRSIYFFLLGCPAGDLSGLFQYDLDEFILQTGWTEKEWEASLDELKKAGKLKTENGDLIWLVNALDREPNKGGKILIHCATQMNKFLKHNLAKQFKEKYKIYFETNKAGGVVVRPEFMPKKKRKFEAEGVGVEVELGTSTAKKPKGKYISDAELEAWIESNLWKPYPVPASGRGSKRKVFQRVEKILEKGMDTREGLARAVRTYARKREDQEPRYTVMAEGFFNPEHERWRELGTPMPDERQADAAKEARESEARKLQKDMTAGLCKTMPGTRGS